MHNIQVWVEFNKNGNLLPKAFKYGHKIYQISAVNLAYTIKKGAGRVLVFNVEDKDNPWTLIYDTENLIWKLGNSQAF